MITTAIEDLRLHDAKSPVSTPANARPFLRIEGVTKTFGDFVAVDDVTLDVAEGEFFSLLGGSGCGKSTLLRILAGLEQPTRGRILVDGQDITNLPPYRRPVNMMFQSYALFPHLNVFDNVAFGLRQQRIARRDLATRVNEVLAMLELRDFAKRRPDQLSGGQRQRVALARALVKQPRLLLLDEPLAALDKRLRERTALELARIKQHVGTTFLLVTHDQEEAMNLSTRLGVMRAGALEQFGTPREIYERPANRFVASFIGSVNLVEATRTADGKLESAALGIELKAVSGTIPTAATCWIAIRPEQIRVQREGEDAMGAGANRMRATVESLVYLGAHSICHARAPGGAALQAILPGGAPGQSATLVPGDTVWLSWSPQSQTVLVE